MGAMAKGGIGDAFSQLNQQEDALDYYEKAIAHSDNEFTAPRFLHKAGIVALDLGDKSKALEYFERIKEEYPNSQEANNVDALIGLAQN
jgi:tetratricopeptide (TPR) repeat protein